VESKNKASGLAIFLIAFCLLVSIAGAFSLEQIMPHLAGWQAGAYAAAAGIFIALTAVILTQILSFFATDRS
jgi:hypothetical protein